MLKLFLFFNPTKAKFEVVFTHLERYSSRNTPLKITAFVGSLQPFGPLIILLTWNHVLESTLYAPGDSHANMMLHTMRLF